MITVTGASGHLGQLAVQALLDRGVPAGDITAVARTTAKAAGLGARGVRVRYGDYTEPETLSAALVGTGTLVLISSSEVGQRGPQHANVIDAALAAGVSRIVYTSILKVDTTGAALAAEHKATEAAIKASGLAYTFLRNGWYTENYTENLATAFQLGTIAGAAGAGRIAAATRADFAAAIAAAAGAGHENKAYELAGDQPFTMDELAAEVSAQSGQQITYANLPAEEYTKILIQAGLPEPYAAILADSDLAIERGDLTTTSTDLRDLIGRPTTSLADAIAQALKN